MIAPNGLFHGLELKRCGEGLSEDQCAFQNWSIARGVPYCVAHNIDQVLQVLDRWNCLRIVIPQRGEGSR